MDLKKNEEHNKVFKNLSLKYEDLENLLVHLP